MLPLKRAKKKRKLHRLIDGKVVAKSNEQLAFISKEASDNIVADAKRNAEASNLDGIYKFFVIFCALETFPDQYHRRQRGPCEVYFSTC